MPLDGVPYTYDAADNRLTKVSGSTTTTTVPAASNKISAVGANSYTYDAAGNITADGINTYVWSAAAQLATVNTTGGVYTYNMNNQRAKKVAGGTTIYYIYGTDGLLYGEYSSTGTLVKEYIYLNGEPLAQITAGSPETLIYLHPDHLGTPRYATNTAGASVWAWTADAFGTSTPTGTATINLRMPGQYFDAESGLFYNWNRYYNPSIGRYISSDPIGLAGGMNTFGYVGQNPVNGTDPQGLSSYIECVSKYTSCGLMTGSLLGGGLGLVTTGGTLSLPAAGAGGVLGGAAGTALGSAACSVGSGDANASPAAAAPLAPNNPAIPDAKPKDSCEQAALAAAKAGAGITIMTQLGDEPRLITHYGAGPWVKRQYLHQCSDGRKLNIHYFQSSSTKLNVELKFK